MTAEVVLANQIILAWLADTTSVIKYMITEVVLASQTILAWLADTISLIKYMITEVVSASYTIQWARKPFQCLEFLDWEGCGA